MAKKWTLKECHRALGTIPKNSRWSWSGRSEDGNTVCVQLWQDLFTDQGKTYATGDILAETPWVGSLGHLELVENLQWAQSHCDGKVSVIIAIAEDKDEAPRKIQECFPHLKLTMKVSMLDTTTGAFTLVRAD